MAYSFLDRAEGVVVSVRFSLTQFAINIQGSNVWDDTNATFETPLLLLATDGVVEEFFAVYRPQSNIGSIGWFIAERGVGGSPELANIVGARVHAVLTAHALNALTEGNSSSFALSNGIIENRHLATASVTRNKIAQNAIGQGQIEEGEVTETKIGTNAVGSRALKSAVIDTELLRDGAVTVEKLSEEAQASIVADKANIDASNLSGIAGWRSTLGVHEADKNATLPEERSVAKSANTEMLGAAVEEERDARVAAISAVETSGRFIGYAEHTVTTSNIPLFEGATKALVELSGGGGGGAAAVGNYADGGVGGTSEVSNASNSTVLLTATGGLGGRRANTPSHGRNGVSISGATGGTGGHNSLGDRESGSAGAAGQLTTSVLFAENFPVNVEIGQGGTRGIDSERQGYGGTGGNGYLRIWWYA